MTKCCTSVFCFVLVVFFLFHHVYSFCFPIFLLFSLFYLFFPSISLFFFFSSYFPLSPFFPPSALGTRCSFVFILSYLVLIYFLSSLYPPFLPLSKWLSSLYTMHLSSYLLLLLFLLLLVLLSHSWQFFLT